MSEKAATRTWLALALASSLAFGEGVPPASEGAAPEPAPVPASEPAADPDPLPLSDRMSDLDFSEDFPAHNRAGAVRTPGNPGPEATRKLPAAAAQPPPGPPRTWAYWSAGVAALAAGGGAAWYLHWGARSAPEPVRDHQVFTDEAD